MDIGESNFNLKSLINAGHLVPGHETINGLLYSLKKLKLLTIDEIDSTFLTLFIKGNGKRYLTLKRLKRLLKRGNLDESMFFRWGFDSFLAIKDNFENLNTRLEDLTSKNHRQPEIFIIIFAT